MRNLQTVNNEEEGHRISLPEYEKSFFVASFTYMDDVDESHWREYASMEDGILFSVSKSWFMKEVTPITTCNQKVTGLPIFADTKDGNDEFYRLIQNDIHPHEIVLYSIDDFDFYKVIYNNRLLGDMRVIGQASNVDGSCPIPVEFIYPRINGIVKSRMGMCRRVGREPYLKNWETEREVRLKVQLQQVMTGVGVAKATDVWFDRIAVSLNEFAFDRLDIRFSPEYPDCKAVETIDRIHTIMPQTKLRILN